MVLVCRRLVLDLQSGKSLTVAMQKNPEFFPSLVITLTNAGERSGELPQVLAALVQYYSQQKELQGFLVKALIYPCFLLLAATGVLCFFLLYVLPIIANTYTAMQATPSTFFKFVLTVSCFVKASYPLVLGGLLGACYLLKLTFPMLWQQLLKVNWCQQTYRLLLEARFCKLLALLLNSGINITEAVAIAGSTIAETSMLAKIQLLKDYLQRGIEISTAIEHSLGLFTPITEELLALGATTGYLPQMLEEAAKIAEADLRDRLEKLREFFAPVLLLVAAVLIAGIVSAVMGPLFDLFTAIPEY